MLDFDDFKPVGDSTNTDNNNNIELNTNNSNPLDFNTMSDMLNKQPENISSIDTEEQDRIAKRKKEAEERQAKINKKIQEEELQRQEIQKKALEYLQEFENTRQENIAKRKKELEENSTKNNNQEEKGDSWTKVYDNVDLKDSEYKGTKDVQRMREAMMNKPNNEPMKTIFG